MLQHVRDQRGADQPTDADLLAAAATARTRPAYAGSRPPRPTPRLDALLAGVDIVGPEDDIDRRAELAERNRVKHAARVAALVAAARVPEKYAKASLASFDDLPADVVGRYRTAVAKVRACLERRGTIVALSGKSGCGKTYIANALILEACDHLTHAMFSSCAAYLDELGSCYVAGARVGPIDVKRRYRDPQLLVLDEQSKKRESKYADDEIGMLINDRYQNLRSTILLTNETAATLERSLGVWVMDRLNETGEVITCGWDTLRDRLPGNA